MANELKVTISATLTNGNLKETVNPGQQSITQATVGSHCPVVSVGTSEEDLSVGDIGTLGVAVPHESRQHELRDLRAEVGRQHGCVRSHRGRRDRRGSPGTGDHAPVAGEHVRSEGQSLAAGGLRWQR